MTKSKIAVPFIILITVFLFACASNTKSNAQKATLTKTSERMFWQIDGLDANGNPSTVYIQGTIHVGDENLYPISDKVLDKWENADRIVGEISSEGWEQFTLEFQKRMLESYSSANGKLVTDYLENSENELLIEIFGLEAVEQLAAFEPWVLTNSLSAGLYEESGLQAEYALDNQFITLAFQSERTMEGLDDLSVQLDILEFGTYDEQIAMLKDTLKSIAEPEESNEYIKALYTAYLEDDVETLSSLIKAETTEEEENAEFYKDFNKAVYDDRNASWAKEIASYLEQGGTTFIFAGSAHWCGENSVFAYLKKDGIL